MIKKVYFYDTELPLLQTIGIAEYNNKITDLFFHYEIEEIKNSNKYLEIETKLIKKAWLQLYEYFNGKRKYFDLPFAKTGTDFQNKVWDALAQIQYGNTKTYKEIAIFIQNPNAYRAVGMANNKNPLPIFIPCHRVIGFNKKIVGYNGGIEIKESLLNLEKNYLKK